MQPIVQRIHLIYDLYRHINVEIGALNHLDTKHLRRILFPECVSEFIVYSILRQRGYEVNRYVKKGDLEEKIGGVYQPIEVKCVTSHAPISFGPRQSWEKLYILKCDIATPEQYDLICIPLSNQSVEWQHVRPTGKATIKDIVERRTRPRISLARLLPQIPHSIVDSGCIRRLLYQLGRNDGQF